MSKEVIALIDRLIAEHRVLLQDMDSLVNVVNDAGAILSFNKAREVFMPGRHSVRGDLEKLDELLGNIDTGLRAHFNREETGLHAAFEKSGGTELASAYHSLIKQHDSLRGRLVEHENIRKNLLQSLKELHDPERGSLSRHTWEATAHDIRAYMTQSRKLIQEHTVAEQHVFLDLREKLSGEAVK